VTVSGTNVKGSRKTVRILAAIGALLSGISAAGTWMMIGFQRHYFPAQAIVPRYVEVAVWSMIAVYLAVVAYVARLAPWRAERDQTNR
jgi:formate hydrogenlyase subunit 3/multisubunit Na+/H+ antiporter MnhD subunit